MSFSPLLHLIFDISKVVIFLYSIMIFFFPLVNFSNTNLQTCNCVRASICPRRSEMCSIYIPNYLLCNLITVATDGEGEGGGGSRRTSSRTADVRTSGTNPRALSRSTERKSDYPALLSLIFARPLNADNWSSRPGSRRQ